MAVTELERHVIDCARKLAEVCAKRAKAKGIDAWESFEEEETDALAELCIAVEELEDA